MLLDHADPECTGRWALRRDGAAPTVVACGRCGAAYPRTARAEDAGEHEHELERLLAHLGRGGRALLAGERPHAAPRWSQRLNEH